MHASFLVSTPEHVCDPALAIAAVRAGALGLLDLGFETPQAARRDALERLAAQVGPATSWGARWNTWGLTGRMPAALEPIVEPTLPYLLLAGLDAGSDRRLEEALQQAGRVADHVLLECYDADQARRAARLGFDGVVLVGNEAGGRVGSRSAFLLLQDLRDGLDVPFWVKGAWGVDTAAAALLAGAHGVVLGEELWLARETPFDEPTRRRFASLDGSETICFGEDHAAVRLFRHVDRETIASFEAGAGYWAAWPEALLARWREAAPGRGGPLPLGQGVAFAERLASTYATVGGILRAFRAGIEHALGAAPRLRALAPDGPLAAAHGTRYPIAQGPMTRVSDTPAFAQAVAERGGLPFLALALLRGDEVAELLEKTQETLGDLPWGVGILGFVPPALRQEQLKAVRATKPCFAIIAGGRPSQAAELEAEGIATYLHVPSPGLLEGFLEQGARRFVLEGRECGGHVGPRSSFVLWQSAIHVLLASGIPDPGSVQLLFAGGVHDALSAAMVQALAVPLVERGVQVGVLMGTAYLFTPEAVETGAIRHAFQDEALACRRTTLLESGLGHATRCSDTAFPREFRETKARLQREGRPPDEIRLELEMLNVGRLRTASKGLTRLAADEAGAAHEDESLLERSARRLKGRLVPVGEDEQRRQGLYMIGQLATLKDGRQSMAALHDAVSRGGIETLQRLGARSLPWVADREPVRRGEPIAIVGMACLFPDAPDLRTFWGNVLAGVDSVRDVPPERWDAAALYDPDRRARDRLYARRGAFLDPLRFDPVRFMIPPATVGHIEPAQLLALEVARRALDDAGLLARPFDRERTSVVFGSSGIHDLGIAYAFRTMLAHFLEKAPQLGADERAHVVQAVRDVLPEWSEDSFAGFLPNVISGRITNRLDLRGANFVVDAACSASLAAVHTAVEQLRSGTCDVALAGAVDCSNNAFTFMGFAKTQALTPGEHPRPFDAGADGIVLGEGVGAVVLKRLADAERDGDAIHAVIRGVGCSSDGRNRSLTAPHPEGQVLALRRAYADAGVDPRTVELVEAHATGTTVGDAAEIEGLRIVYGAGDASCAVGSVKSQIGHAKTAAGMAGLIKAALSVQHGILPPTIHVETPNPRIEADDCPFYVNARPRPWIPRQPALPRRAGVSAFGFGGTNFHLVLESWERAYHEASACDLAPRGSEVFAWRRSDRASLGEALREFAEGLASVERPSLPHLASAVFRDERSRPAGDESGVRLALVASSVEELATRVASAREALAGEGDRIDPLGTYLLEGAPIDPAQVAFLFPGQGAQRVDMLGDLVRTRPFSTTLFSDADRLLEPLLSDRLSRFLYPPPAFTRKGAKAQDEALKDTRIAQPAVGVVDLFALDVLATFGLEPAFAAGHSYGEYVALAAAGVYSRDDLLVLSAKRGRAVHEVAASGTGGMAAVAADAETVQAALDELGIRASIANRNAPRQTIIAGGREGIDDALKRLSAAGLAVRPVAVSAAFHTPAVQAASDSLVHELDQIDMHAPRFPVYSNVTAAAYPADVGEIKSILNRHLAHPVLFVQQIRAMRAAGARVFLEAGPGRILTGLVKRILEGEEYVALSLEQPGRDAWSGLAHLLAHTWALGLPVDLGPFFAGRRLGTEDSATCFARRREEEAGRATDWWVEPAGSRPVGTPGAGAEAPGSGDEPDAAVESGVATPASVVQPGRMASPSETPSEPPPPRSDPGPADAGTAAQVQVAMAQWIELQREQQRLNAQFLALQERLLDAQGVGPAGPARHAPASDPGGPFVPVGLSVAPAPVLPRELGIDVPPAVDASAPRSDEPPADELPADELPADELPADEAEDGPPSVDVFRRELLAEVARRTGYPEDMLELDLPLEAGLGIDSIKVMEIFSALKRYHPFLADPTEDEEEVLARFTQLHTLRAILDHYEENRTRVPGAVDALTAGQGAPERASTPPAQAEVADELEIPLPAAEVERYVLRSVPSADPGEVDITRKDLLGLPEGAGLLVVGDLPELGVVLRTALETSGHVTWHVVHGSRLERLDAQRWSVDLDDPAAVVAFAERLRGEGRAPVGGWVNLLNLDPAFRTPNLDRSADALQLSRRLLHLAQAFENDLRREGLIVNLTALDGRFGLAARRPLAIAQAASLGFFKALAKEWPDARIKSVDIDPDAEPSVILTGLAGELAHAGGPVEVGLDGSGRWRLDLEAGRHPPRRGNGNGGERLAQEPASALPLDGSSVLLVTGGADGITAEILKDVASASGARLVVVGRSSPSSVEGEPPAVREVTAPADVRSALIRASRTEARARTPAEIETEVARVLKARRIRANLAAFEAAGSAVEYHVLDVRDEARLEALIEDVYRRHGRIDGVIHGAGVIEDKRIHDKSSASFARVFDTKVKPALVFARALRSEALSFLVFFSSVSGRFGNAGQADYSAANEVLNKLANHLDREWPGRVVAINWGPWDAGMLSDTLRRAYAERGIGLITPDAGRRAFREEVGQPRERASEVVLACTVGRIAGRSAGASDG